MSGVFTEVLHAPCRSIHSDESNSDVGEVAENVGAMARGIHPRRVHLRGGGLAHRDIFAGTAPARRNLGAVAGVVNHGIGCTHLVRPLQGHRIHRRIVDETGQPRARPSLVHEGGDRVCLGGCGTGHSHRGECKTHKNRHGKARPHTSNDDYPPMHHHTSLNAPARWRPAPVRGSQPAPDRLDGFYSVGGVDTAMKSDSEEALADATIQHPLIA